MLTQTEMNEPNPLDPLRTHPAFALADILAAYVGIHRDLIQWTELLSLAAGKMAMPINLEIVSEQSTADLHIANRILDLAPEAVQRIDTDGQFRELEKRGFEKIAAILVRDNHPHAFRNFIERMARSVNGTGSLPSLWRISYRTPGEAGDQSTLRLMTPHAARDLTHFGSAFAAAAKPESRETLSSLLSRLPSRPMYVCHFREQYTGRLATLPMLVFERFLQVFAAIRINLAGEIDQGKAVVATDYRAVKAMLTNLPLAPVDRSLSSGAVVTAEAVFDEVSKVSYQQSLADQSKEGNKWFSREIARHWTGLAYNTVKDRLEELHNCGILLATRDQSDRGRGKPIYYRFAEGVEPPFNSQNPFDGLPDLARGDYLQ